MFQRIKDLISSTHVADIIYICPRISLTNGKIVEGIPTWMDSVMVYWQYNIPLSQYSMNQIISNGYVIDNDGIMYPVHNIAQIEWICKDRVKVKVNSKLDKIYYTESEIRNFITLEGHV